MSNRITDKQIATLAKIIDKIDKQTLENIKGVKDNGFKIIFIFATLCENIPEELLKGNETELYKSYLNHLCRKGVIRKVGNYLNN